MLRVGSLYTVRPLSGARHLAEILFQQRPDLGFHPARCMEYLYRVRFLLRSEAKNGGYDDGTSYSALDEIPITFISCA